MTKAWLMLILSGLGGASAQAGLTLQTAQPNYSVAPGGSLTLTIQLVETSGTILRDGDGLFSFGFDLSRSSGNAQMTLATRDSVFDAQKAGSTSTFPAGNVRLWAEQDDNFGLSGPGGDGSLVVNLATVTFNVGTEGGTFQLADFGALDQTVLYSGDSLDSAIDYRSFTIAVPEPAIGWMLIGSGGLLKRRRRMCKMVTL